MPKILVTPQEYDHMFVIYNRLMAMTAAQNGTPAVVTASFISSNEWSFATVDKMVRYGALKYCATTGTYYLHLLQPQPPSDYFTNSLLP